LGASKFSLPSPSLRYNYLKCSQNHLIYAFCLRINFLITKWLKFSLSQATQTQSGTRGEGKFIKETDFSYLNPKNLNINLEQFNKEAKREFEGICNNTTISLKCMKKMREKWFNLEFLLEFLESPSLLSLSRSLHSGFVWIYFRYF
jgi:hypothetical protein